MSTTDQPGALPDGWRTLDEPGDDDDPELKEVCAEQPPIVEGFQNGDLPAANEVIGVCVSGGGIRSAAFALGVLSQLDWGTVSSNEPAPVGEGTESVDRSQSVLGNARYLAAVSGGAWAATAWTLRRARTIAPGDGATQSTDNGAQSTIDWLSDDHPTPGFGFQRQNYLMNGSCGIIGPLLWILLCVGVNLVLIGSLIALIGWVVGWVLTQCWLSQATLGTGTCAAHHVPLGGRVGWVLGAAALVGVALLLRWLWAPARYRWARGLGFLVLGGGAALYLFAVVLPNLFVFIQNNPDWLVGSVRAVGASAGLAVLAGVWKVIGGPVMHEVSGPLARIAPRLMGVVMAAGWLLTAMVVMYTAAQEPRWTYAIPIVALVLILLIVVLCTPNRPTLHNIFSKRLQRSFQPAALCAALPPEQSPENGATWDALNAVSRPTAPLGLPELVLCCSSQRHGIAPGGLRADVFTVSPRWVRQGRRSAQTEHYIDALKSVQFGEFGELCRPAGWLAITGAAFSSAMGRTSLGTTNAVLAAANIDLGNWLPNLAWLQSKRGPGAALAQPSPALRRPGFTHLYDEIVGRYSPTFRYSFITDGGHWDNLGLVELLRRNCDRIYCVDASADRPGTFTTLRESMTLASLELGTEWDPAVLDKALAPLTLTDTSPPLRSVATFKVPRAPRYNDTGKVVVHYAKLQATLDMSLKLKRYATADPKFPMYSTMKQFLSPEQFNRLVMIGRDAGAKLAAAPSSAPAEGTLIDNPR